MNRADILRREFLDFFKKKKHKIVESDSLIPKGDPTVLFTPAGMNQFKREFMGFKSGFRRAATAQRCLRTDDLDKVGKTNCHHTFFEMLGNFSFGNYFKEEAIVFAWEFLTQELKIKEEKLWVSIYKDDEEAYGIWKDKIKIPSEKIMRLGDKENFWPSEAKTKGPNGPCGPCSEIFFDQGSGKLVEVWNLVFTQFNRKEGGVLEPLPQKNIDTGMGLERLTAVIEGVESNFQTFLFKPIIETIINEANDNSNKELVYAVADHIRAIVFSIYDGVIPSNETRGYVVRKIIRKGILHLRALGLEQPFLYKLVPVVAGIMKEPYPELVSRKEDISQLILAEEKSFISILNSSQGLFADKFKGFKNKPDPDAVGRAAFQLYDTYGIPLELSQDWLHKKGIKISDEAFQQELSRQKNRSKTLSAMKGDVFAGESLYSGLKTTKFSGYREHSLKAKIIRIIKDNSEVKKAQKGDKVTVVLDETVFYPEGGGQVGDTGILNKGRNVMEVLDTKNIGRIILHMGYIQEGSFKKNDTVGTKINLQRRLSIARNHTATHLLQAALRKVLGTHVKQQGSLVAEERLRFDFTHFKDISDAEMVRIEQIVNAHIMENHALSIKILSLTEAKKLGALAFFGEKYTDKVRMVSVTDISKELCAGTHLGYTGQIGLFKIAQEGSIASGVRRIEAITGKAAYKMAQDESGILRDISLQINVPWEKIPQEIEKRIMEFKELEKKLKQQSVSSVTASLDTILQGTVQVNNVKVITSLLNNSDMDLLRMTVDLIKAKTDNAVIVLGSGYQSRALLVMGITSDLTDKGWDASKLIPQIAKIIGGSGGGRKDFAQAGGSNPDRFQDAFKELKNIIGNLK